MEALKSGGEVGKKRERIRRDRGGGRRGRGGGGTEEVKGRGEGK